MSQSGRWDVRSPCIDGWDDQSDPKVRIVRDTPVYVRMPAPAPRNSMASHHVMYRRFPSRTMPQEYYRPL
jgi:hypothetical protein